MPFETSAIRLLDSMAEACGFLRRPLQAEELIESARRRMRLQDFGEFDFNEPLRHFLDACVNEASLSLVGRIATRWDTLRFLGNLLRLRHAERQAPALLDEPIERPIFITGLPRSGTTFLHRLMMADPANRAPLVWETIYPYPEARRGADMRADRVARQLRAFERLAPEFRDLHPLNADSPQECSEITAHVFRSLRFDTNYQIPSYLKWLESDAQGQVPAYRFHRRFLQHLQHQSPRHPQTRWVVKCPDHVFALDAIRIVYPDARLVFVHRDPMKVLLSVAKLTEVLRRPFTRHLHQAEIGRQESARWLEGTRRMMAAGDSAGLDAPICHVHYLDLVSDPVASVGAVYRHFGLTPPQTAINAMGRFVAAKPNGGYGPRAYRFEDHGLDAAEEIEKFRPYLRHFGIRQEPLPVRGPPAFAGTSQEMAPRQLAARLRVASLRAVSRANKRPASPPPD